MWTREQSEVINRGLGNRVIYAAPGSGKTSVLTEHLARVVLEDQLSPKGILAMTFTRESAHEMKRRLQSHTKHGQVFSALSIGTFHAQIFKFLLQVTPNIPVILDRQEQMKLMRTAVQSHTPKADYDVHSFLSALTRIKSIWPQRHERDKVSKVIQTYEHLKNKYHRWDFDDILVEFCRRANANGQWMTQGKAIQYILVDEFQDTNQIQWCALQVLRSSFESKVFVVGDDDQSIYSFRGGSPSWLMNFSAVMNGSTEHLLSTNFRSDQCIIRAASSMIQFNQDRINKPMVGRSADVGCCRAYEVADEYHEAILLAQHLQRDRYAHPGWKMAILARTRKQLQFVWYVHGPHSLDHVQLRTFHDAKGKEWDAVYIIGAVHLNPYLKGEPDIEIANWLAEERRTLYVAITRSKHLLRLYVPRKMQHRKMRISEFVIQSGLNIT
jgi:DNA helicase-2/ATP-dependent DNA helicase PcrA